MNSISRIWLTAAFLCAASGAAHAQGAPPLKHYVMMALTNPVAGKEDEYNNWYTNVHLPDLLKIPGVKSAQRFKIAPEIKTTSKYKYLSLFDVETNDIAGVQKAIRAAAGTPAMVISPALDAADMSSTYYEQITGKVESAAGPPAKATEAK